IADVLALYRPTLGRDVTRLVFFMNGVLISDPAGDGDAARAYARDTDRRLGCTTVTNCNIGGRAVSSFSQPLAAETGRGPSIFVSATSFPLSATGQHGTITRTLVAELELATLGQVFDPLLTVASDVYVVGADSKV